MKTVIELLHEGARAWSDMPYLGEKNGNEWSTSSFLEVERQSLAFAASLVIRGFRKGDPVAILAEGRSSWVVAEFGILKAGCVSVPLSVSLTPAEIRSRILHCGAKALLVSEYSFDRIAGIFPIGDKRIPVVCISPDSNRLHELLSGSTFTEGKDFFFYRAMLLEGQHGLDTKPIAAGNAFGGKPLVWIMREIEKDITENDTAVIQYGAGGSDGAILLSHRNFRLNAQAAAALAKPEAGWKILLTVPLSEAFAQIASIYAALIGGQSVYFADTPELLPVPARGVPQPIAAIRPEILISNDSFVAEIADKAESMIRAKNSLMRKVFANGLKAGKARYGNGFDRIPFGTRLGNFLPWKFANGSVFPRIRALFGKNLAYCVCKGDRLGAERQDFFSAIGITVYPAHTLANGGPIISVNTLDRHKTGTVGSVIPGVSARILGEDGSACAPGEIGHIAIDEGSIIKGFFRLEDRTGGRPNNGVLPTDDYGYIDHDGFLVLTEKPAPVEGDANVNVAIFLEKEPNLINT
jgi:long-chain acyl-CoA synthetase